MIKERTGTQGLLCRLCGNVCKLTSLKFNERLLARCSDCGVMQIEPFPSRDEILSFYANENFALEDGMRFNGIAETVSIWFRVRRAKSILNLVRGKNAKILDIGAGRGVMLNELKNYGWETHGTTSGDLRDAHFPQNYFDVVTLFHVLEHLEKPAETLLEIHRVMKPDGILILETPNAAGFVPRIFKTRWFGYNVPVHLYHFTPESLKHILRQFGFDVCKEHYFSPEQSPFILLQTLLNTFLHDNGRFFESLRQNKNNPAPSYTRKFAYILFAAILAMPALAFSRAAGILKQGDVMTFYCKKT